MIGYKNKKTKLDPNKDMNLIKEIINHYLHKINLYFDYQYQHSHSSRNDKTLQFFINKKFDIKIVENEVKVNKFYFNNKKIETDNIEQYDKQFTIMNKKQLEDMKPNAEGGMAIIPPKFGEVKEEELEAV